MLRFNELSKEDKEKVFDNAKKFFIMHKDNIISKVKKSEFAYSPSGSDIYRPELWKEAHWSWFLEETNEKF